MVIDSAGSSSLLSTCHDIQLPRDPPTCVLDTPPMHPNIRFLPSAATPATPYTPFIYIRGMKYPMVWESRELSKCGPEGVN